MSDILAEFEKACKGGGEPGRVPMVLWGNCPWITDLVGVRAAEYYHNAATKLHVQLQVQDLFPEVILIPGIWPDFGVVSEPVSAFGGEIVWEDNESPFIRPVLRKRDDILKLKPPKPLNELGLGPQVLSQYRFFWDHLPKRYVEKYGYLDGVAWTIGPVETAALLRGYCELFVDMYDEPSMVHRLLEVTTQTTMNWLSMIERVNGALRRLVLVDHVASMISLECFDEFYVPYVRAVYSQYPGAIKIYHNEGNCSHVLHKIPELGADVFHFGPDVDIARAKGILGNRITLMGNLDPKNVLNAGSTLDVERETKRQLSVGASGGRYVFTCAAAPYRTTPRENLEAMVRTALAGVS
ncbi:MAG: uroporphyrinogen decarboxylase family protein [Bacillota bacterium]